MTDNEIIKALDCCSNRHKTCHDCVFCEDNDLVSDIGNCVRRLKIQALDLINRQKAEIENLNIELSAMRGAAYSYKAEAERLSVLAKLGNMRANDYRAMRDKCKTAKAEAYKEFAERLKENAFPLRFATNTEIDNLLKELVGEDK